MLDMKLAEMYVLVLNVSSFLSYIEIGSEKGWHYIEF